MSVKTCGRLNTEVRTPGRNDSPDGPPETWQSICPLPPEHEEPHEWLVWTHVYR